MLKLLIIEVTVHVTQNMFFFISKLSVTMSNFRVHIGLEEDAIIISTLFHDD